MSEDGTGVHKGPGEDASYPCSASKAGKGARGVGGRGGSRSPVSYVGLGTFGGGKRGGVRAVDGGGKSSRVKEESHVKEQAYRAGKRGMPAGGCMGRASVIDMDSDAMLGVHTLMMLAGNNV